MKIEPYLFFEGRCDEAIEFYKRELGAEVERLLRYKDSPVPSQPGHPAPDPNKVMHCNLRIGDAHVMVSDGMCSGKPNFSGFKLSVTVATDADADKCFAALSEGGTVEMPIGKTFFSSRFGMCTDKFGVEWMIMSGT